MTRAYAVCTRCGIRALVTARLRRQIERPICVACGGDCLWEDAPDGTRERCAKACDELAVELTRAGEAASSTQTRAELFLRAAGAVMCAAVIRAG